MNTLLQTQYFVLALLGIFGLLILLGQQQLRVERILVRRR